MEDYIIDMLLEGDSGLNALLELSYDPNYMPNNTSRSTRALNYKGEKITLPIYCVPILERELMAKSLQNPIWTNTMNKKLKALESMEKDQKKYNGCGITPLYVYITTDDIYIIYDNEASNPVQKRNGYYPLESISLMKNTVHSNFTIDMECFKPKTDDEIKKENDRIQKQARMFTGDY